MADFEHNKANLGAATLSSAITSSQTSITVDASDASTFPSTPFYATISPIGETPNLLNAEIVNVTAISSGTLTVARGQRSTTARNREALRTYSGYRVSTSKSNAWNPDLPRYTKRWIKLYATVTATCRQYGTGRIIRNGLLPCGCRTLWRC